MLSSTWTGRPTTFRKLIPGFSIQVITIDLFQMASITKMSCSPAKVYCFVATESAFVNDEFSPMHWTLLAFCAVRTNQIFRLDLISHLLAFLCPAKIGLPTSTTHIVAIYRECMLRLILYFLLLLLVNFRFKFPMSKCHSLNFVPQAYLLIKENLSLGNGIKF